MPCPILKAYKLPCMYKDKLNLFRDFVASLETTDEDAQSAILEALDVLEEGGGNTPSSPNNYSPDVLDIDWETLLDGLKTLVADSNAGNMQIILQNNSGGHYLFFKTNDKIEFVTNVPEMKDLELAQSSIPINVPPQGRNGREEQVSWKSLLLTSYYINLFLGQNGLHFNPRNPLNGGFVFSQDAFKFACYFGGDFGYLPVGFLKLLYEFHVFVVQVWKLLFESLSY